MNSKILSSIFFLSVFCFSVFGQNIDRGMSTVFLNSREIELWYSMVGKNNYGETEEAAQDNIKNIPGTKITGVGILMSAVVPGAGEFYAGSWLKGAIFLSAEIALWIGYSNLSDKGQEWEDTFHDYADTHWDETTWRSWMAQHPTFGDTSHSLPSTKTQQYYEMIGKYDQFKAGWDDYVEGSPALTTNRHYYEGLRHKSNRYFIRASYCAMTILANHLISAFDASWTIRKYNRRLEGKMRVSMKKVREEYVPLLTMRIEW